LPENSNLIQAEGEMARKILGVLSAAVLAATTYSAHANYSVFSGVWSGGARASFSLKAEMIITYCFHDEPCSDYRYEGSREAFSVTFPKNGDYAGGYMELRKIDKSRYSAEFYYGEEAKSKIGTKSVIEFELN
jgi:hypothetical protein